MTLSDLVAWVSGVPAALPEEMRPMAQSICESFQTVAKRLMDLGLGYLALDRAAATLSTGERQRMQLARAACCMCWMNPLLGCTPPTSPA